MRSGDAIHRLPDRSELIRSVHDWCLRPSYRAVFGLVFRPWSTGVGVGMLVAMVTIVAVAFASSMYFRFVDDSWTSSLALDVAIGAGVDPDRQRDALLAFAERSGHRLSEWWAISVVVCGVIGYASFVVVEAFFRFLRAVEPKLFHFKGSARLEKERERHEQALLSSRGGKLATFVTCVLLAVIGLAFGIVVFVVAGTVIVVGLILGLIGGVTYLTSRSLARKNVGVGVRADLVRVHSIMRIASVLGGSAAILLCAGALIGGIALVGEILLVPLNDEFQSLGPATTDAHPFSVLTGAELFDAAQRLAPIGAGLIALVMVTGSIAVDLGLHGPSWQRMTVHGLALSAAIAIALLGWILVGALAAVPLIVIVPASYSLQFIRHPAELPYANLANRSNADRPGR